MIFCWLWSPSAFNWAFFHLFITLQVQQHTFGWYMDQRFEQTQVETNHLEAWFCYFFHFLKTAVKIIKLRLKRPGDAVQCPAVLPIILLLKSTWTPNIIGLNEKINYFANSSSGLIALNVHEWMRAFRVHREPLAHSQSKLNLMSCEPEVVYWHLNTQVTGWLMTNGLRSVWFLEGRSSPWM